MHKMKTGSQTGRFAACKVETDRYHFFETVTDVFDIFTDIWPVIDAR